MSDNSKLVHTLQYKVRAYERTMTLAPVTLTHEEGPWTFLGCLNVTPTITMALEIKKMVIVMMIVIMAMRIVLTIIMMMIVRVMMK